MLRDKKKEINLALLDSNVFDMYGKLLNKVGNIWMGNFKLRVDFPIFLERIILEQEF